MQSLHSSSSWFSCNLRLTTSKVSNMSTLQKSVTVECEYKCANLIISCLGKWRPGLDTHKFESCFKVKIMHENWSRLLQDSRPFKDPLELAETTQTPRLCPEHTLYLRKLVLNASLYVSGVEISGRLWAQAKMSFMLFPMAASKPANLGRL